MQLVRKLTAGLRVALRATVMLPERIGKQQYQQLSQKVPESVSRTGSRQWSERARATYLRRPWSVQLVRKPAAGLHDVFRAAVILLSASANSNSSSLARKCQPERNQGQAAAARGRRRLTPSDPRPSARGSMIYLGYFGDARHDRTIGVRPLPRAARATAVRKLPADDGEQSENGRVPPGRRSRATHRQGHAPSRTR